MAGNSQPEQSTGKASTRRTDAEARAIEAARLRIAGLDYAEIARRLGYADKSGAWRAVEGELSRTRREVGVNVMALELERLDILLRAVLPAAEAGNLGAVDRVLRIMERRARYLDLDGRGDPWSLLGDLTAEETRARIKALEDEILRRRREVEIMVKLEDPYHGADKRGRYKPGSSIPAPWHTDDDSRGQPGA